MSAADGDAQHAREIEGAMERLRAAERQRRAAIGELVRLGAVRSRVLVGDLGEQIAAAYYGVALAPQFTPGYDLVDCNGRRVQVKTLRATPERPRTIIGALTYPSDVLLAIRLDLRLLAERGTGDAGRDRGDLRGQEREGGLDAQAGC